MAHSVVVGDVVAVTRSSKVFLGCVMVQRDLGVSRLRRAVCSGCCCWRDSFCLLMVYVVWCVDGRGFCLLMSLLIVFLSSSVSKLATLAVYG